MPTYKVQGPDGKTLSIEGPDGATDEQLIAVASNHYAGQSGAPSAPTASTQAVAAPNTGMMSINSANKGLAAIPDALLNTPNRIMNLGKMAFGTAATAMGHPDMAPEITPDPNYARQLLDKIGATQSRYDPQTSGQRVLDSVIQGGVAGAVSPANGMRQALTNAALGGASGAAAGATKEATGNDNLAMVAGLMAAPVGINAIGSAKAKLAATDLRKQQNAVRDQTISQARDAGYVLSPSETNPSTVNQTLEGVAGKLSTRQLASQDNQELSNSLARNDIGVANNVPLSRGLMQQVRRDAYDSGYKPVEGAGTVRPGRLYRQALDDITTKYTGAANSFPAAVTDEVKRMVDSLRVAKFDSGDAVKMTQILRDDASKSFSSGDKALGQAQRAASNAIEDQIERGLSGQGQNGATLLENFREARKTMAKTHTIEKTLHEGSGNVIASKLAAELRKGKPLSGGLELIARTADTFPKNMQSPETMGAVPGISPLDVFSGAGMGIAGAAATGSPYGALAAALPAVRPVMRSALLSGPYQKLMGQPTYKNSMMARLLAQGSQQNPQATQAMIAQILASQAQDQ